LLFGIKRPEFKLNDKINISWEQIYQRVNELDKSKKYYGIPRGGSVIAGLTLNAVNNIDEADILIDDLIDSGKTKQKYNELYPNKEFIALFDKSKEYQNKWLIFPYEEYDTNKDLEDNVIRILEYFNYDLNNESIKNTPKRFIKMLKETLTSKEPEISIFDSNGYSQMITDKGIKYYTFCEHHILPFFGDVKISYIPKDKIIGLSKLSRIVEYFSKRLNTQEYLTENIADYLMEKLNPLGVGVEITGRHLCKEMRGIKQSGTMVTTALRGMFYNNDVKQEFLSK
jgi:GTP cyclohydrolase I